MRFSLKESKRLLWLCLILLLECVIPCQSRVGWSPHVPSRLASNNNRFLFGRYYFCRGGGQCPPPPPPPPRSTAPMASTVSRSFVKRKQPLQPPPPPRTSIQHHTSANCKPQTTRIRPPPPRRPQPPPLNNKQLQINSFIKKKDPLREQNKRETKAISRQERSSEADTTPESSQSVQTSFAANQFKTSEQDVLAMYEALIMSHSKTDKDNVETATQSSDARVTRAEQEETPRGVENQEKRVWDLSDLFAPMQQTDQSIELPLSPKSVEKENPDDWIARATPGTDLPEQLPAESKLTPKIEPADIEQAPHPSKSTTKPNPTDINLHPTAMEDKSLLSTFQTLLNYRRDAQAMVDTAPDILSDFEENDDHSPSTVTEPVIPKMLRQALDKYSTDESTERTIVRDILSDNEENLSPQQEHRPVAAPQAFLQQMLETYTATEQKQQEPREKIVLVRKKVQATHKVPRRTVLSSITDFASDLKDDDFTLLLSDLAMPSTVEQQHSTYEYDEEVVLYDDDEEDYDEYEFEEASDVDQAAKTTGSGLLHRVERNVESSYDTDYDGRLNPFLVEQEKPMQPFNEEDAIGAEVDDEESEQSDYDREESELQDYSLELPLNTENSYDESEEKHSVLDMNKSEEVYSGEAGEEDSANVKIRLLSGNDVNSPNQDASTREPQETPEPLVVQEQEIAKFDNLRPGENHHLAGKKRVELPEETFERSLGKRSFGITLEDLSIGSKPALNERSGDSIHVDAMPSPATDTATSQVHGFGVGVEPSSSENPVESALGQGAVSDSMRSSEFDIDIHPPHLVNHRRSWPQPNPPRMHPIHTSSPHMRNDQPPPPKPPPPVSEVTPDRTSVEQREMPPNQRMQHYSHGQSRPTVMSPRDQTAVSPPRHAKIPPPPPQIPFTQLEEVDVVTTNSEEYDSEEELDETELKLLGEADVIIYEDGADLDAYTDEYDHEEDSMDEDDWRILQLSQWMPNNDDDGKEDEAAEADINDLYFFEEEENDTSLEVSSEDLTDAGEYAIPVAADSAPEEEEESDESTTSSEEEEDTMFLGDAAVEHLPRDLDQPPPPPPASPQSIPQHSSGETFLTFGLPPPPTNRQFGNAEEWLPPPAAPQHHDLQAHHFGRNPQFLHNPRPPPEQQQQQSYYDETRIPPPPAGGR